MNELIRQTKCLPICFPSQTAKFNVCQMYHSYGIKYTSKCAWPIVQEPYAYLVCYVFLALDYIVVSIIMFSMNSYLIRIE